MKLRQLSVFCGAVLLLSATAFAAVDIAGTLRVEEGTEDLHTMAVVSMPDAIDAAVAAHPGTAIDVELEVEQGFLVYVVDVLVPEGTETEVLVDAGDGNVLLVAMEEEDEEGEDPDKDVEPDPALAGTVVTLAQAVRSALELHPGFAVEAWLEPGDDEPAFEVGLVDAEGMEYTVFVDARTGEVYERNEEEKE